MKSLMTHVVTHRDKVYWLFTILCALIIGYFAFAGLGKLVAALEEVDAHVYAQAEKLPVAQRSIEVIDHEGQWLYIVRVRTCYYLIVGQQNRVIHLEDCPSPVHQKGK